MKIPERRRWRPNETALTRQRKRLFGVSPEQEMIK